MQRSGRFSVFALGIGLALIGSAGQVHSQSGPAPGRHPNNAIQAAVDSATGQGGPETVTIAGRSKPVPQISGGVLSTVLSATGRQPSPIGGAVTAAAPVILPLSNGCRNVFTGNPDNMRVNQDCTLRRQAEEFVAINPTDPNNVLVGYNDSRIGFNHTGISYSLDRGITFGDLGVPFWQFVARDGHTFDAASDPAIAFDSRGNAYYAAVLFQVGSSAASALLVTKSNADFKGSLFHSPNPSPTGTQLFRTEPSGVVANDNDPAIVHDKEFIASDQSPTSTKRDRLYVTWTRFRSNCGPGGTSYCESPIYFSESSDGGATYSPGIEISGRSPALCVGGNSRDPSLDPAKCNFDQGSYPVVGSDGTVYVAFNNGNTPDIPNQQLLVRCLPTSDCRQAASWQGPFKIADDIDTQPFTCPQAPGRQCLPPNSFRMNDFPFMAIDPNTGQLFVTWADFRNGGPCATDSRGMPVEPCANHNNDVFVSSSLDGGVTWTDPVQVEGADNDTAQVFPAIGVDTSGTVYVSYYDRRFDLCESLGCQDYSMSWSTDGGATWLSRRITTYSMPGPESIATEAGFLGDYTSLAADSLGPVMVWADTRGLFGQIEEDVYFTGLPSLGGTRPQRPSGAQPQR